MKVADSYGLIDFLDDERVATLAVPIDETGTLHIATMLFVCSLKPLKFYFVTSNKSEKCRLMNTRPRVAAACGVGNYYGTPFTLQMRGQAKIVDKSDHQTALRLYQSKHGDKNLHAGSRSDVLIEFSPDWARYIDYSKGWDEIKLELE